MTHFKNDDELFAAIRSRLFTSVAATHSTRWVCISSCGLRDGMIAIGRAMPLLEVVIPSMTRNMRSISPTIRLTALPTTCKAATASAATDWHTLEVGFGWMNGQPRGTGAPFGDVGREPSADVRLVDSVTNGTSTKSDISIRGEKHFSLSVTCSASSLSHGRLVKDLCRRRSARQRLVAVDWPRPRGEHEHLWGGHAARAVSS